MNPDDFCNGISLHPTPQHKHKNFMSLLWGSVSEEVSIPLCQSIGFLCFEVKVATFYFELDENESWGMKKVFSPYGFYVCIISPHISSPRLIHHTKLGKAALRWSPVALFEKVSFRAITRIKEMNSFPSKSVLYALDLVPYTKRFLF